MLTILQENTIIASKKNNYTFILKSKHKYKNGDLDVTDKFGNTALYYAVSGGHYETVDTLLKLGANVNSKNEFGNTPLHKAIMLGDNEPIINLLINFRGDLNALNNFRQTPIFFSSKRLSKQLGLRKLTASIVTYDDIGSNSFKMDQALLQSVKELKAKVQLRYKQNELLNNNKSSSDLLLNHQKSTSSLPKLRTKDRNSSQFSSHNGISLFNQNYYKVGISNTQMPPSPKNAPLQNSYIKKSNLKALQTSVQNSVNTSFVGVKTVLKKENSSAIQIMKRNISQNKYQSGYLYLKRRQSKNITSSQIVKSPSMNSSEDEQEGKKELQNDEANAYGQSDIQLQKKQQRKRDSFTRLYSSIKSYDINHLNGIHDQEYTQEV